MSVTLKICQLSSVHHHLLCFVVLVFKEFFSLFLLYCCSSQVFELKLHVQLDFKLYSGLHLHLHLHRNREDVQLNSQTIGYQIQELHDRYHW